MMKFFGVYFLCTYMHCHLCRSDSWFSVLFYGSNSLFPPPPTTLSHLLLFYNKFLFGRAPYPCWFFFKSVLTLPRLCSSIYIIKETRTLEHCCSIYCPPNLQISDVYSLNSTLSLIPWGGIIIVFTVEVHTDPPTDLSLWLFFISF